MDTLKLKNNKKNNTSLNLKFDESFKQFASRLSEGVYVYDITGKNIIYWNKNLEGIFSCLNGELKKNYLSENHLSEIIHPEDKYIFTNRRDKYKSISHDDILELEYRIKHGNSWKWVRSKESVLERKENNLPQTIIGLVEDITHLKEEVENIKLRENYFKTLIQYSTDIITLIDKSGNILFESPSVKNILGYTPEELVGKNAFDLVHKEDLPAVYKAFKMGLNILGKPITVSFRFRKKDGSYVYLESIGTNYTHLSYINGIIVNSRDVTKRKLIENDVKRLSHAVEQSSNTVVITDINGNIEYVNKKFVDLTGYTKEEAIGKNPSLLKSGETNKNEYYNLWETILTGKTWEGEFKNKKKNGEFYWETVKITPVIDANDKIINFIAIKHDITVKKQQEEELKKNLEEKELMLREIHHRVKNNLQIVNSLLNLQQSSVDDPALKAQLKISQNRVKSMALIHQLLYKSNELTKIDMEDYLMGLASFMLASYGELKDRLNIIVKCKDIFFSIETAVPFGLLVNELITNSLKHGFPDLRSGNIEVSLSAEDGGTYVLEYNDNGIGMPLSVVNGHVMTFGMYLIDTLVTQLDGVLELNSDNGTAYKIRFKGSNYQSRFNPNK
jgi:PAS domain S-box-containing protein